MINDFFMHRTEHQGTNGGIAGKDEGAGGTGQGDSHAAGEFSLISHILFPPTYFRNVHHPTCNLHLSELFHSSETS